tara:strand:- start:26 stop:1582 length:1557 start_codon:yes stop_codon:yes gene_type:complete
MSSKKKDRTKKEIQNKSKSPQPIKSKSKHRIEKKLNKKLKTSNYKNNFYYSIGDEREKEMIKQNTIHNRDEDYVDIDVLFGLDKEDKKQIKYKKQIKKMKKKKQIKKMSQNKLNYNLEGGAEGNETQPPNQPTETQPVPTETPPVPKETPTTETPSIPTETPSIPTENPTTETPSTPTENLTSEKPSIPTEKPTIETPSTPTENPTTETPSTPTEKPPTDDNSLESLIDKAKKNDDDNNNKSKNVSEEKEDESNEKEKPITNKEVELFEEDVLDKFNIDDENNNEEGILNKLKTLKEADELGKREGYYLIGIDFGTILGLLNKEKEIKLLEVDYPGKYKNEEEKLEAKEKLKKLNKEKSEREKSYEGRTSLDIFGDYIDEDADKLAAEILGLQDEISSVALNPEEVVTKESTITEILEESKKYKKEHTKITPNALYTMVKMLSKRKKSTLQWLRVASLCEIIYKFLTKGEERDKFFKLKNKINQEILEDLDEFWKTDFIFRGPIENQKYRDLLEKHYM